MSVVFWYDSMSRAQKTRRIVLCLILATAGSCFAPVIYARTDCDRWLTSYKQQLLHNRQVRRLRAAKWRMQHKIAAIVHPPRPPVHKHVLHRRMGPLEALKHFQIACDTVPPVPSEIVPVLTPMLVPGPPSFALPPITYTPTEVAEAPPPAVLPPAPDTPPSTPSVPVSGQPPIETYFPPPFIPIPPVTPVPPVVPPVPEIPEPSSIVLVLTGVGAAVAAGRRRFTNRPVQ